MSQGWKIAAPIKGFKRQRGMEFVDAAPYGAVFFLADVLEIQRKPHQ